MSDTEQQAKLAGDVNTVRLSSNFTVECRNRCGGVSAFEKNGKYSLVFSAIDIDSAAALDDFIKEKVGGLATQIRRQCEGDVVQYTMPIAAFERCVGVQPRQVE